jgi:hypothetical protein
MPAPTPQVIQQFEPTVEPFVTDASGSATATPVIGSLDGRTTPPESVSSFNTFFEVDENLEIDDTDIDLVEPRSDLRWRTNGVVLPLDRPLPKVEDQNPEAAMVTPVVETVAPIAETITPVLEAASPVAAALRSQELHADREFSPSAASSTPAAAPIPIAPTAATTPAAAPVAIPAATPAVTPVTAFDTVFTRVPASSMDTSPASGTPAAAPVVIPTAPAAPTASVAPATPTPAPVAPATAVPPVTIDITPAMSAMSAAAAAAATTIPAAATPVPIVDMTVVPGQETVASVSPDVLVTDTALDIDDSEDDEYYDEGYDTGRERMSSPLFILIVLLVLIIQVIFVGWLVSTGFIDVSSVTDFFDN